MDVLDQILGSLRLTGGVVIDGEFSGDYCVRAQFTPNHCAPFFPLPETLISYHYVRSGRTVIEVEGMDPASLGPGSVAILPRNDPHLLSSRPGLPPADVSEISWITADGIHRVSSGTPGEKTEVWCGFLGTSKNGAHPLLDALPPLLTMDVAGGKAQWLDSSMRFLAEQTPPPDMVARFAELFLSQAIREYIEALPAGSKGWLRGLADPAVSKALSIIHTRYADDLDVEGLAREAGVSRTVLGERFGELIGEPPMRYCARWRMRLAASMLREGQQNTGNIAYAVGFNSEAAFNRAFKREYGEPPATWRRRLEAEENAAARAARPIPPAADAIAACTSADGTKIAYASCGEGPTVVKAPNCVTHLEHDRSNPIYGHWVKELSRSNRLVRFDMRGFGMSGRLPPTFTTEDHVNDLAAVVEASGIERCDLVGLTHGAAIALAYAARNPERIRKLVLVNAFPAGWAVRADPDELALRKSLMELDRKRWRSEGVLLGDRFMSLYFPSAAPAIVDWHKPRIDDFCEAEGLERMLDWGSRIDVREVLPKVRVPTLIFHAVHDGNAPIEVGRQLADALPDARLVELDSSNHVTLESEPAWSIVVDEMRAFLAS